FTYGEGGFTLDPSKGIRAEWLPRQSGGGSTLRLLDQATGTVIAGPDATAAWNGEAPTRTSDWTAGDPQIDLIFWDSRSFPEPTPYFVGDNDKVIVRMPDGL